MVVQMKFKFKINRYFFNLFFAFWFIFQCFLFLFCLCVYVLRQIKVDLRIIFDILISKQSISTLEACFSNKRKKTTKPDTGLVFQDSENYLVSSCIWP